MELFEKEEILREAIKQGIVDIDSHPGTINYDVVKLATELTKKHGPKVYKDMENRRRAQELGYDTSKMTMSEINKLI